MRRELLLGCGSTRDRRLQVLAGQTGWENLTTLDMNAGHKPDVVFDLEGLGLGPTGTGRGHPLAKRLPFDDDTFDEIHGYELFEHTGQQGDWRAFFAEFSEYWRVLKPGGFLCGICPSHRSMWAWGDPSHRRVITSGTLVFLSQSQYERQVGKTPMSDFRPWYKADFETVFCEEDDEKLAFVLRAIKA